MVELIDEIITYIDKDKKPTEDPDKALWIIKTKYEMIDGRWRLVYNKVEKVLK